MIYPLRRSMDSLNVLQEHIGYKFKNIELLEEALTHRSYNKPYNNERLEFIGDSILNFSIASYLYKKFPDINEGSLSKLRSSLVSQNGLFKVAEYFSLGEYLLLSEAEERNRGRVKKSLLSNGVEAIIAAIYLDSGEDIGLIQKFIIEVYEKNFPDISLDSIFKDYKTTLQEITQSHFGVVPTYTVLSTSGPDHEKVFEIGVYIDERLYGKAVGRSKKSAEQNSAKLTIGILEEELQREV
jgi:ribonuclease-3